MGFEEQVSAYKGAEADIRGKRTTIAFVSVILLLAAILAVMAVFVMRKTTALINEQQAEIQRLYDTNTKLYKQNVDLSYQVEYYKKINDALEDVWRRSRRSRRR